MTSKGETYGVERTTEVLLNMAFCSTHKAHTLTVNDWFVLHSSLSNQLERHASNTEAGGSLLVCRVWTTQRRHQLC